MPLRYDRIAPKPRKSDKLFEKQLDTPEVFAITPEHYKQPLPAEKWLERANYAFREGIPRFHIPKSDIFYIKALIRDRLGYDLPVLYVEQLLLEEGLIRRSDIRRPKVERDQENPSPEDN